jgi:hypothetical protein
MFSSRLMPSIDIQCKPGPACTEIEADPILGQRDNAPLINNHVFKFITTNKFQCGDFIKTSDGIVRLTSDLAKTLLGETALPEQDIVQAPEFMLALNLEARHVAVTSLRPRLPDSIPT